ncbi:hypothetical protein SAMN06295945_0886 [Polynucleobacter meluiroseus]|jgi:uncharacterized protein|uniref:DUF1289 domain-containing protein n=1 Tax=Polynucleobacter meluiroseus TaxID=1938814 RepID=A0A240E0X2_9BURK|nr:DUF1289 domain-containing protein [Polynucleobacter meluiroseus]SNX28554.1 hypothetical protein SAMN06295945_0886 [Polynucleobacter meluiroseus]
MTSNDNVNNSENTANSLAVGDDASDSPCIGVCTTLYDEICQGCGRTLGEVSNWVFLSQEEKEVVWKRIRADGTAMRFQRQIKAAG